jgi:hypothetical protein
MLETLQRVGEALADTRGRRKSVVLFSEGIDYDIQDAVAQDTSGIASFSSSSARNNVTLYAIDPRGIASGGDETIEMRSLTDNPLPGLSPDSVEDEISRPARIPCVCGRCRDWRQRCSSYGSCRSP